MNAYLVIFNNRRETHHTDEIPNGEIISRHRTLSGAQRAYRRRNPHLFNRRWAEAHGYANTGTFDEIVEVDSNGYYVRHCYTGGDDYED